MPITSDEIKVFLSGGGSNTDVNASLGGAISTTEVSMTTVLHNLFDKVTGDESHDGDTEYRIVYVRNTSNLDGERCKAYFSANWLDQMEIGVREAVNVSAATLTNESTAPNPAVTFSHPDDRASAVDIGDLDAGQYRALYLKRTIAQGAAAKNLAETTIAIDIDSPE